MSEFSSVILRQSSTPGLAPHPVELLQGELAINLADRKLYSKNSAGSVIYVSADPSGAAGGVLSGTYPNPSFSATARASLGLGTTDTPTFAGINLSNGEFISNASNGRVDIGPNGIDPASPAEDFMALTIDGTWGFGVFLGTRNTRTDALNTGNILFQVPCILNNDTRFSFGSSQNYFLRHVSGSSRAGLACGLLVNNAGSTGSLVMVQGNEVTAANRIPTTAHADPTLYLYGRGSSNAAHYMRMNHNTTNGVIETGAGKLTLKAASAVRIEGASGGFDLPATAGIASQVLTTDGTNASWQAIVPAGSNQQIQFNSSGAFAGSSNLLWDSSVDQLTVGATSGILIRKGAALSEAVLESTSSFGLAIESPVTIKIGDPLGVNNSCYVDFSDNNQEIVISGFTYLDGAATTAAFSTINLGGALTLQNEEFIRNTTNGRIDFMPAPSASDRFGLYADVAGWPFGVRMGIIRSSDNVTNPSNRFILYECRLAVATGQHISLHGSDWFSVGASSSGNDTMQIGVLADPAFDSSGAVAICSISGRGANNRSPTTKHANPTLYVYSADNSDANDFVRLSHNQTDALIETGTGALVLSGAGGVRINGSFGFATAPTAVQTGYTAFTNLTTDRTCDANATTVEELADILGTLIEDLKAKGIISA